MDFSKINTRLDAERGAWLQLTHPQLGHPLYTGVGADDLGRLVDPEKPHQKCELKVKGVESEVIRNRLKNMQGKNVKDKEDDEFVASMVTDVRGIENGERQLEATISDMEWLFGRSASFKGQVLQFALDGANFFRRENA